MDDTKITKDGKWKQLRVRAIPVLLILVIVAVTVCLFLYFRQNPENIEELEHYGYLGAFLIALISTASVFLPTPGFLILVALGTVFNPILIGLVGALGGALGETTGYILGHSGRVAIKSNKTYTRAELWMKKRGFWAVFFVSMIPILPIDIVSIVAGALRYTLWKFLLACFFGKAVIYIVLIQASALGWDFLLRHIS
jgi:uncharacterized membrane protein YdjX (TVP38/TMEM64 family)